jgi:hypothetical protein
VAEEAGLHLAARRGVTMTIRHPGSRTKRLRRESLPGAEGDSEVDCTLTRWRYGHAMRRRTTRCRMDGQPTTNLRPSLLTSPQSLQRFVLGKQQSLTPKSALIVSPGLPTGWLRKPAQADQGPGGAE